MPSCGLIVVLAIILSIGIMSSASNDASILAPLRVSYAAYRNVQIISLYALYVKGCLSNVRNATELSMLIAATSVSASASGIGVQATDNSIILRTLAEPTAYAVVPLNQR